MANEIKRMHYFNGLFLQEADFGAEQKYNIRMRRMHNRHLHTNGIVWGLQVQEQPDVTKLVVTKGMALDRVVDPEFGDDTSREIFLSADTTLDLGDVALPPLSSIYVRISYKEVMADQSIDQPAQYVHTLETAQLEVTPLAPLNEDASIYLARFETDATSNLVVGSLTELDTSGLSLRKMAGVNTERVETTRITVRDDSISESWPWIDAELLNGKRGLSIHSEFSNFTGNVSVGRALTGQVVPWDNATAVDLDQSNYFFIDFQDASATVGDIALANGVPGSVYYVIVRSNGTSYAFPDVKWPSGIAPIPSAAGQRDMYSFVCMGVGDYLGTFAFNYA